MRKRIALFTVTTAAAGICAVATASQATTTQATTTSVDLGMKGSVVAGVTSAQAGQELPFSFTMTNHSTTSSADISFNFTFTNSTADTSDYVCPLTTSHFDINPDTPSCETGTLGPGKKASAAIMVTPISSGTVTVRACAQDLSGSTDPVSSNNCKTLSVKIV